MLVRAVVGRKRPMGVQAVPQWGVDPWMPIYADCDQDQDPTFAEAVAHEELVEFLRDKPLMQAVLFRSGEERAKLEAEFEQRRLQAASEAEHAWQVGADVISRRIGRRF